MAGLDTTIALGIKPVDFGDPNEGRMNALRAQMMQMQMQQGQFNMMKAQRDMQYQNQQRAAAAAAVARDKAAEAQAIKLYGQTGAPGYQTYSPSMEPGAASDVGMMGGGQGYTEGAVNRLAMPAQLKNFDDAITTALQSGKFNPDVMRKLMALKEAQNVHTKSNLGVDEATTKNKKGEIELAKADLERGAKAIEFHASALPTVTPETWGAWRENAVRDLPGLKQILPETAPADPAAFDQLKRSLILKAQDSVKQHYETVTRGNETGVVAIDPVTLTATNVAGAEGTPKSASTGPKTQALTDDRGDVRVINLETGEQVGPTIRGAGKQGGTFAKAQQSRANATRDMDAAIPELEKLILPNSLLDQSTGSGAGALADSALAFFGRSTQGAEAAAALEPIADRFTKMIPRFEGPQSNNDVKSYQTAAAQLANKTLPVATRRAAAVELLRITKARRGQFGYVDEEAVPELYSPNQSGSGQAPQSGLYAPGTRAPAGGNPYASKSDAEIKAALGIKD